MSMTSAADAVSTVQQGGSALYRAVWRWHFYAGLFVLPFLILLCVTGGAYLLKDEFNDYAYGHLRLVERRDAAPTPHAELVQSASAALPGKVIGYAPPAAPERAAQVKIRTPEGEKRVVFVNPYSGEALGHIWDGGSAGSPEMWVLRKLHSLNYFGANASLIIDLVGCWSLILIITGFYLWWPRKQTGGVYAMRARGGRVFWRDLHAVTGAYAGIFLGFLALSGLPWSTFTGKLFYEFANSQGLGMPDGYWSDYPLSTVPAEEVMERTPWVMEHEPLPASTSEPGQQIGIDQAVAAFDRLGVHPGYAVSYPNGPRGVFTASVYPDNIDREQVVHLDQYSGEVLFNMGFADLGVLGRAAEWGVSVHMGQRYGLLNLVVMMLACVSGVAMSIGALVMWWKRRPAWSLGAPKAPRNWAAPRAVLVIAVGFGLLFPLVGLSIFAMLLIDLLMPVFMRRRLA